MEAAKLPYRSTTPASDVPSPYLVALAAWLVPGAGYWLIGHRGRGVTVGVTIVLLFVFGLLVGGVRVLEVPYYDRQGVKVDRPLLEEVRSKPWSIAQVMTGPVAIAAGAASVYASTPDSAGNTPGAESHARVNEIAILYTAVAGMLNLLTIIDSAHRAGKIREREGAVK